MLLKFIIANIANNFRSFCETVFAMLGILMACAIVGIVASVISGLVLWSITFGLLGHIKPVFGFADLIVAGTYFCLISIGVGLIAKNLTEWVISVKNEYSKFKVSQGH